MNTTTINTILESMSVASSNKDKVGYPAIEWSWNLDIDQFDFRDADLSALMQEQKIQTSSDLLALFSDKERSKLVRAFQHAAECATVQSIFCTLSTPLSHTLIFSQWVIEKKSESTLGGTVQPIIVVPSLGRMADIFVEVFDNQHHGIVITDAETHILACNPHFAEKSGYSAKELLGKKTNTFNAGKHSRSFFEDIWQQVHRKGFWTGTVLSKRKNGIIEPQELTLQKIELSSNKVYYVGYTVDLSNHLYRIADTEHGGIELLTQLPNETEFSTKLLSLAEAKKASNNIIVMTFLPNLDAKSAIEHRVDISNAIAKMDNRFLCGYLKENLFVAALKSPKSDQNIKGIHAEIRQFFHAIKRHVGDALYPLIIKGKVGVSVLGFDTSNPKSLIAHATQAMLEQHSSKGYNISFFDTSIHKEAKRRKKLEDALIAAIRKEEIDVHFQPIVSTSTWRVVKFEALCRFNKMGGESYSPQELINLAEELNLINNIDRCVGRKSLEMLQTIRKHYGSDIGITINRSLNTKLSAKQVLNNAMTMIQESGIEPENVTIELTESAYFASEGDQIEALKALREIGVKVAIDDFGTGYSSFSYLSHGHFDFMKIDREFVMDIEVGTQNYFIVKTLINLSHTLGVKVIAEGAETIQEVKVLTSLGVDFIQGYYFSKPVPIDQIEQARHYTKHMKQLEPLRVPEQGAGILSLCDFSTPMLEPSAPLADVHRIFSNARFDALMVVDQDRCVGLVDREVYNLHLSPTLGTKIETQKDSVILKRKINQVMKTTFTTLSEKTTINDVARLLERKTPLPWVIADQTGKSVGIVSSQRILDFFIR
ncbi:EAL domain-containing protein [Vibrio tapetis subsp. quintayensis]|uniref:EAL domain-containing protein n=1 Tax=Vibrio tapetis TaxID=52443 RepID=UPI0025B5B57A|nr:EAL domain-containing protein [Vibrio tapetis]MDN3682441.1 EAL domain-containing protein [Vibrio tapetis subsp. quintayensis]